MLSIVLREYLVHGISVRDIAAAADVESVIVRAELARAGIKVDAEGLRDPVCAAVAYLGYGSFRAFIRERGLCSRTNQAFELSVPIIALERIHTAFEALTLKESSDSAAQ